MTTHRKLPPRIEPKATTIRPVSAARSSALPGYAAALAAARSSAIRALMVIAPLGALAGTVSACGAAAPVQPGPAYMDPTRSRQSVGQAQDQDDELPVAQPDPGSNAASPPQLPQPPHPHPHQPQQEQPTGGHLRIDPE